MGSRNEISKSKLKVPGPGTYQHFSNILLRPSSKFGRAKRKTGTDEQKVPGPGRYKPLKSKMRPKSAYNRLFGLSKRQQLKHGFNVTPGPGHYNISGDIGKNNKKGLIKKHRPSTAKVGGVPGPGAYNPLKLKSNKN
jgi:hypothetical protein